MVDWAQILLILKLAILFLEVALNHILCSLVCVWLIRDAIRDHVALIVWLLGIDAQVAIILDIHSR